MNQPDLPVLVVDDQKKLGVLVAQLLGRLGFSETHLAETGEDALAMLRITRYALIISDLNLEPMDGMRLLQHVRSNVDTANVPFILTETDFDHYDIRQALGLGADGILLKPYEVPLLRSKIAYAVSPLAKRRRRDVKALEPVQELPDLLMEHMRHLVGARA